MAKRDRQFHAARIATKDPCLACGHRLDRHWTDDVLGLSCDACTDYCEKR